MNTAGSGDKTLWILLLCGLFFLMAFYPSYLFEPRNFLFSDSGDGLKGYYTYAYHINNDSSAINTRSFNYPFGEHFIFTDGHPFPSILIQKMSGLLKGLHLLDSGIGLLNFIMVTSFLFGLIVVYRILRFFGVGELNSSVFSFAIMILAPQIDRHTGHLSLIYSFLIPLCWYLMLRFCASHRRSQYKYTFLVVIICTLLPFIHVYYLLIVLAFMIVYYFIFLLIRRRELTYTSVLQILMQILVPLIIFQAFIALTDYHLDRTENPYGLLVYTSHPVSVFLPEQLPLSFYVSKLIDVNPYNSEGRAYVGFVTVSALIAYLFYLIRLIFFKRNTKSEYTPPQLLNVSLLASVPVLLYSFGWAFDNIIIDLRDLIPKLAQFRSLGRFAWVFYFTSTVFAAVIISRYIDYLKDSGRYSKAMLILSVCSGLLIAEGLPKQIVAHNHTSGRPNYFKTKMIKKAKPEILVENVHRYQAIIPLPFYHFGSEAYTRNGSDKSKYWSMISAYHNRLPLVASALARTSRSEAYKIGQIFAGDYYYKNIVTEFPDKRDFLLIYTKEDLPLDEAELLAKAKLIKDAGDFTYYVLPFDSIFSNRINYYLDTYNRSRESFFKSGYFLTEDSTSVLFYNAFDDLSNSKRKFLGKGAATFTNNHYNRLMELGQYNLVKDQSYTASFWYYTDDENVSNNMIVAAEKESADGPEDWIYTGNVRTYGATLNGWTYCEFEFKPKRDNPYFSIFLKGEETSDKEIFVDEFLLRKTGTSVFSEHIYRNNTHVFYNMFPLLPQ